MIRPQTTYFICTVPRSGSWLLADALERTRVAGRPREFFEPRRFTNWQVSSYAAYVREIIHAGTTANGVFGVKFHWYQFKYACSIFQQLPPRGDLLWPQAIESVFGKVRYIWLTRRDKVRQAISYYRASRTDQWWSINGESRGVTPQRGKEAVFDAAAIQRLERVVTAHDTEWQRYFEESGLEPLVIHYEELAAHFKPMVKHVLRFLDIPQAGKLKITTRMRRQADALTEAWTEQYLDQRRGKVRVDSPAERPPAPDPLESAAPRVALAQPSSPGEAGHNGVAANGRTQTAVNADNGSLPDRQDQDGADFFNKTEIRIAAIQRSGHHGIINWIGAQCAGSVYFLNDAAPATNPFLTCTLVTRLDQAEAKPFPKGLLELFVKRDWLIYNYEDRPLEAVFNEDFERRHDSWVGRSGRRYDVIVLRDPFNMFASRLSASWMRNKLDDQAGRAVAVHLWKAYAREALDQTHYALHNKIFINYNRWFCDQQYRRGLAQKLGLRFTDLGRQRVRGEYGGSSFDGLKFNGRAEEMGVLERWKRVADNPLFREICADRELHELSQQLFGSLPGSEQLTLR